MDILAAIKREERKLEKQLGNIQHKLNGVRAAAKALGTMPIFFILRFSLSSFSKRAPMSEV
jgi:hypothetical protein